MSEDKKYTDEEILEVAKKNEEVAKAAVGAKYAEVKSEGMKGGNEFIEKVLGKEVHPDTVKAKELAEKAHVEDEQLLLSKSQQVKKDIEENPQRYIKILNSQVQHLEREFAKKTLEYRALEKNSVNAVIELENQLKQKDNELELKDREIQKLNKIITSTKEVLEGSKVDEDLFDDVGGIMGISPHE